jgi:hypothetical protein
MAINLFIALFLGLLPYQSSSIPEQCLLPFPRSYLSYSLKEHEDILVDGKLEEDAWKNVAWTESFLGNDFLILLL